MTMQRSCSIALAVTGIEIPYISHSHCTCLPASSLPLLLVNQNLVVTSGLTKAANTSAAGLRISMPVLVIGTLVSRSSSMLPPVSVSLVDGSILGLAEEKRADGERHQRDRDRIPEAEVDVPRRGHHRRGEQG